MTNKPTEAEVKTVVDELREITHWVYSVVSMSEHESLKRIADRIEAEFAEQKEKIEKLEFVIAGIALVRDTEKDAEIERLTGRSDKAFADTIQMFKDKEAEIERLTSLATHARVLIDKLDILEESDSGKSFRPNRIASCRVLDSEAMSAAIDGMKDALGE